MNGEVTLTVAGARTQEVAETVGPSAASWRAVWSCEPVALTLSRHVRLLCGEDPKCHGKNQQKPTCSEILQI
jgi:hypothetical protein